MTKPDYVYVTYIASTPQKVWEAITTPEMTRRYWFNHRNASDWQPGSEWRHEDFDDATEIDAIGKVIAAEPPNKLVLSWADPDRAGDPSMYSQLTIEIGMHKEVVRVQITHAGLDEQMFKGISFGWPLVLSNLKTFLETGATLPDMDNCPKHEAAAQAVGHS